MSESKRVHVAVGVIKNTQGLFCVAKRPQDKHMGGYWEFPGGKVEVDESVQEALKRELHEELSIEVEHSEKLLDLSFHYPQKEVFLDVHLVNVFSGEATGNEGQEVRWVSLGEMSELTFPEANEPILRALGVKSQG